MRLLILGGTRFVGHAVATAALRRGWEVATFNRGLSGADVAGVNVIRGDRTLADADHILTDEGALAASLLALRLSSKPAAGIWPQWALLS